MHGILHMEHNFKGEHSSLSVVNGSSIDSSLGSFFRNQGKQVCSSVKKKVKYSSLIDETITNQNTPPMNRNMRKILQRNAPIPSPNTGGVVWPFGR